MNTENVETIDPSVSYSQDEESVRDKDDDHWRRKEKDVVPLPLNDYVENIEVLPKDDRSNAKRKLDECMREIPGLAQQFIQKVRSSQHVGVRTYRGRISRRNLHKYKTSKYIFHTENKRKKKDASVMIVVDCSGSMNGGKITTARKAAMVMGEIMYRAKVEFEVVGFTIFGSRFNFNAFTRKSNLIHYRFANNKNWDQRKFGVFESKDEIDLSDNDDGESLRQFASEIATSKKERKMMVVISDGAPMCGAQVGNEIKDLHVAIKEIRDSGIDVYAVGLDTDVQKFYGEENAIRISSRCKAEELVAHLAKFIGLIGNG